ncbi:hypothetical protein PACTADRAFT_2742 [Pachysolen tannophilus NRRL Y-2460]|uniref:tRNA(His) guanylyltransferase n=1 Tax=Pachysolen tannophilus NRRL Y-2460 TaxID=669874 RepID=A0A1E4TXJ3_PACTA|nr:hypothetical protein PACTADRAFT_2742 [Pachysolen tannophilus NRRL Y-2460]
MANSRFEYVKNFERENYLLPDTYIVVRVDGRGFHKFSDEYNFEKPNDLRALNLMNKAAISLMKEIPEIVVAYGDSDEYSFLLRKDCELFERREAKLITTFSSSFSSYYQFYWAEFFVEPESILKPYRLPTFDARAVCYPNSGKIRDYFSWRQVDCHINNLYNTVFWNLVSKGNLTPEQAENRLIGTLASDKNEILFKEFAINYNNEPEIFKKGTVIVRELSNWKNDQEKVINTELTKKNLKNLKKADLKLYHTDIINDTFWQERPYLLI